jgi:CRISPR/Cas system-associated exonuclease Cas4 (RecB family)
VVLEIKSGPLPSWLPLQLAGYSILLNAFSGVGIQLRDNDKYSVKLIKTPELFKARRQFLEMLDKVKRQRRESNGTKTESDNGSQK